MNARRLIFLLMLMVAASAWVSYAEHPNPRNLRRAILDSLGLI